jgi:hypothetical protein
VGQHRRNGLASIRQIIDTEGGDVPMKKALGRHLSPDGEMARELFPNMHPSTALRKIQRAGGAAKLKVVSPEVRAILLRVPSKEDAA